MTNIEKRLHNAEVAICALASIVSEFLPPEAKSAVNKLTSEYFDSMNNLGSSPQETMKNTGKPFLTSDS